MITEQLTVWNDDNVERVSYMLPNDIPVWIHPTNMNHSQFIKIPKGAKAT